MSDWPPIETAPKDGTEIVAYFPLVARLTADESSIVACDEVHFVSWSADAEAWLIRGELKPGVSDPTLWTPHPSPPKETA
jgi:hypothetical protein